MAIPLAIASSRCVLAKSGTKRSGMFTLSVWLPGSRGLGSSVFSGGVAMLLHLFLSNCSGSATCSSEPSKCHLVFIR